MHFQTYDSLSKLSYTTKMLVQFVLMHLSMVSTPSSAGTEGAFGWGLTGQESLMLPLWGEKGGFEPEVCKLKLSNPNHFPVPTLGRRGGGGGRGGGESIDSVCSRAYNNFSKRGYFNHLTTN